MVSNKSPWVEQAFRPAEEALPGEMTLASEV
jgi:hypothetical protein